MPLQDTDTHNERSAYSSPRQQYIWIESWAQGIREPTALCENNKHVLHHGRCDAGTRLMFKFRSGTHGLNEELGRHKGRKEREECLLCDNK